MKTIKIHIDAGFHGPRRFVSVNGTGRHLDTGCDIPVSPAEAEALRNSHTRFRIVAGADLLPESTGAAEPGGVSAAPEPSRKPRAAGKARTKPATTAKRAAKPKKASAAAKPAAKPPA